MPNAEDAMRCWAWPIDEDGEAVGDACAVELGTIDGRTWAREVCDPVEEDDLVDATRYGTGQILSPVSFTYHVDPAGEADGWLGTITRGLTQAVRDTTGQQDLEVVVDLAPLVDPLRRLAGEIVDDVADLVRRLEAGDSPIGRELLEAGERHRQALRAARHVDPVIIDDPVPSWERPTAEVLEDIQAWMDTVYDREHRAFVMGEDGNWGPGAPIVAGEVTEDGAGLRFVGNALTASGGICAPLSPRYEHLLRWHPAYAPIDQLDHDGCPDGCWATAFGDEHDADADACNRIVVDELGLCAEHRARMVDQD